ncbi:leucyl aminopeptidase [Thioflexithrix psekupsensis]|uniref:Probable cytosol aminopeptidase n=2 Tax=Thioflexithrix psekupsensis TaxID=1570016 RepID=A0A251X8U5_9GAMM|nr:leucyl aminopeptidase [Thioflexithrix psekupsensis]OUD14355.1 leucyl aminopeptidase [Thioflexithrix psekupsensis]
MEFNVKSGQPEKQRTACVVVGVYEPRRLSDVAQKIDEVSQGHLSSILRRGDLEGKIGQTLLLHNVPNMLADRVLLVGCGRERELGDSQYRKIIAHAIRTLHDTGSMETVCYLTELNVRGRDTSWRVRHAIETAHASLYTFDQLKSKKNPTRRPLRKIVFSVASRRELPAAEKASREAQAVATGVALAKDLGNLPGNICTPTYLADRAKTLCSLHEKLTCKILTELQIEKQGMNALLAVSRGSDQAPRLIIMEYKGGKKGADPIVLIGKGVTFDTGGISLKPAEKMDEMKFDMCGAASVLGTLSAVAELQLPLNVIGIVPAVENMPSGKATKPGDIVTTLSGQTVEILNTDAEGRLILCDSLTYAERYKPEIVIDIATLTGACVVALGSHAHGLLSNHNPLTNDLLNAGRMSGDRAWELPLWDEYQEQLDSPFADMANIGGKPAGTITAACFLSRFARKYHWAHLDIAGTGYIAQTKEKGSTGRPVPLLTQYLINRSSIGQSEELTPIDQMPPEPVPPEPELDDLPPETEDD